MRLSVWLASAAAISLAACGQAPTEPPAEPQNPAQPSSGTAPSAAQTSALIEPGDLIFWGGEIYTANDDQRRAEAVVTRDGRIVYVGDEAQAQQYLGDNTRIVDLNGGALYPGFTDSHVHVLGVGSRERTLNLDAVTSIEELVQRVSETIADADAGTVVFGRGWIETHWPEARFPNREDLDAVSPDNPVILVRADGHALVANSAALDAGAITRDSVAPEGGEILFDDDGEPTGMLIDTAMYPVSSLVSAPTGDVRADIYAEGSQRLASLGWAGAHDMSVPYADVEMIEGLAEADRLSTRVYVSINPGGFAELAREVPRIADDGMVITRAVKLYMDGALGSRGAALLSPYSDRPDTAGLNIAEPDETVGVFIEALRNGIQMNVHAIGDRGNRLLLDWVEEAQAQVPADERALPDHRWRDEHTQIVHPDDFARFAELGVIASMQPSHAIGDLHFAPARLGEDRLDGAYAWQTLLDHGAHLTGGSDAPVEQGDPRIEFYAAVARADLSGFQGENWRPEEALSRDDALKLFTLWPAYASFREDELGSIEEGKRADFSIFSGDIMTIEYADILTVTPWMTVVDGEVTWEHPDSFHQCPGC